MVNEMLVVDVKRGGAAAASTDIEARHGPGRNGQDNTLPGASPQTPYASHCRPAMVYCWPAVVLDGGTRWVGRNRARARKWPWLACDGTRELGSAHRLYVRISHGSTVCRQQGRRQSKGRRGDRWTGGLAGSER